MVVVVIEPLAVFFSACCKYKIHEKLPEETRDSHKTLFLVVLVVIFDTDPVDWLPHRQHTTEAHQCIRVWTSTASRCLRIRTARDQMVIHFYCCSI